jgi:hypothetical protein
VEWVPEEGMTSAQRKLKRGIEHIRTLCRETKYFEDGGAYSFEPERELRSSREAVYRCFAVEREAPPGHWSLLAGEAIQNLRSAFDHLVYEVSEGKGRTQFPIFTDPDEFKTRGLSMIKPVPTEARTSIEKVQPFRSSLYPDPSQAPLAVLNDFSNRDKHRILAAVVSAVTHEGVGVPEGINLTWEDIATNKPLGPGRQQISTFRVRADGNIENVKVEPMFSYEVRIEGRQIGTLRWIGNQVYRAFYEVEKGEPPPLFLHSPL